MRAIDIGPADLETVRRILHEHAPGLEVRAFGSRVSWTARGTSDLDLAVMTTEPLDTGRMAALKAAFTESDLPFRVDIVDWASTSESFRKVIERDHVVLEEGGFRQFEARSSSESDEWRESTLGGLLLFSNGKSSPERSDSLPYPVYGSNGIIGFSDEMNAPPNTTVIGRVGSYCGSLHYSERICWVTDNAIRANATNGNDAKFLFYLLQTLQLNDRRAGSGQPLLNQTILSSIPVVVPPPFEQRAIAHILGTLDDKIELNRRMNETLEAMARALFKSWFVDFDPVRAKMEGRDTGLPNNIADLFPDQMVESELGEIPEGWEVGCLADIAVAPRRGIDPTDLRGETPYIGLEHMPRRSIALTDWEGTGKVTSNKSFFEKGEFLFGKLRPYFHKVGIAPISGVCSTDIVVIAPRSAIWSAFLLATISSVAFVNYTDQTSTGTKMPRTSWKTMSRYAMCLPTDTGARAFQKAMGPILARTVANIHQNRTLAVLRETLLPKLISGEIRARHTKAQQLIGHT